MQITLLDAVSSITSEQVNASPAIDLSAFPDLSESFSSRLCNQDTCSFKQIAVRQRILDPR